MDKFTSHFRLRRFSDTYSFRPNVKKTKEEESGSHLKWLALSSNTVSFLPVFLADPTSSELNSAGRASSAESLSPGQQGEATSSLRENIPSSIGATRMPPPSTGTNSGAAFKATMLWEKIVIHLERSIKCGRHAHGLRIFDNCFQGSKAVHNLTTYLNSILPKTIKRDQVLTLCQKLMDTGVIEDVKDKGKMFREGRLYRFTKNHFWETSSLSGSDSNGLNNVSKEALKRTKSAEDILKEDDVDDRAISRLSKRRLSLSQGYVSDSSVNMSNHQTRNENRKASFPRTTTSKKLRENATIQPNGESLTLTRWKSRKSRGELVHVTSMVEHFTSPNLSPVRVKSTIWPSFKLTRKNAIRRDREADTKVAITTEVTITHKTHRRRHSHKPTPSHKYREPQRSSRKSSTIRLPVCESKDKNMISSKVSLRVKSGEEQCNVQDRDMLSHSYCIDDTESHEDKFMFNCAGLNRSHSFASQSQLQDPEVAPSAPPGMKWVVYGFV